MEKDASKNIKLIGTDLDGTLLNSDLELSRRNKEALLAAIDSGIHVVVATGRALSSIPKEIKDIPGIRFFVCANGARVFDKEADRFVYASFISEEAIRSVWDVITNPDIMIEAFWEGKPYAGRDCMDDLAGFGVPDYFADYVRASRNPVDDLYSFIEEHITEIENINFNYKDEESRNYLLGALSNNPLYEFTTSLPFNFEIGGKGVNKASGLDFVCKTLDIRPEETLCFGDNRNDISMIEYAGIGIAMEDGVEEAKQAADTITLPSYEDGVAFAIELILGL